MKNFIKELKRKDHPHVLGGLDIFKYIGPGLLVTVGFIDPGNWASNFAAGSEYGYALLWVVTLSTIMLIALQHNVAHLGCRKICPQMGGTTDSSECYFSQYLNLIGRDIRGCHRVANALWYQHPDRCNTDNGGHTHHALH